MTCPHLARAHALADGTLDAAEHEQARAHLAECAACREVFETAVQLAALADQSSRSE